MIEAINAGRIPPAFQEDLQARSNELVNTVNCPPPPAEDDGGDEQSKKDEKKKDKQEELIPTEPLPTVPEDEE